MQLSSHRVPLPPGKIGNCYRKIYRTWKVLRNDLSPGKSWNLLGNGSGGSFLLQIGKFLLPKIAIVVATRHVIWAAGMPIMMLRPGRYPRPFWGAYNAPETCCLSLYLNIAGL